METDDASLSQVKVGPKKASFVVYDRNTKKSKLINIPKEIRGDAELTEKYIAEFRRDWKNKQISSGKLMTDSKESTPTPAPSHDKVGLGTSPAPQVKSDLINLTHKSSVKLELSKKTGTTMVCYGSSKRGKSTLMIHIWKKYFNCSSIISTLFSGNPHIKCYKKAGAKLLTAYGFTDMHAKYIMMQQYINCKTNNQYQFVNLFDDIIDQKRSAIINKLILTYRNANISLFICLQYIYLLSKQNRANVNHTFVFGMNSIEDIKGVLEICLGTYLSELGITNIDNQVAFFREMTRDHGFFHLDNITGKLTVHRLLGA